MKKVILLALTFCFLAVLTALAADPEIRCADGTFSITGHAQLKPFPPEWKATKGSEQSFANALQLSGFKLRAGYGDDHAKLICTYYGPGAEFEMQRDLPDTVRGCTFFTNRKADCERMGGHFLGTEMCRLMLPGKDSVPNVDCRRLLGPNDIKNCSNLQCS